MQEKIYHLLEKYLLSINFTKYNDEFLKTKITVSIPKQKLHGDFATNIALKLAKELNKQPLEIAQQIVKYLNQNSKNLFTKIVILKPGFINFYFNPNFLANNVLLKISNEKKINLKLQNRYINIEFLSANPTGLLHIGHARNAIVGDINVKILEALGNKVVREYYVNDAGNQIIKLGESVYKYYLDFNNLKATNLEEIGYKGQEIIDYAKELSTNKKYLSLDTKTAIEEISYLTKNHFLTVIKKTVKKLNVQPFDIFTSEQELYDNNDTDKVINNFKKTDAIYEKDGALFIKTSNFTDTKDRVILKSDKTFTYMTADIANHVNKYEKKYDLLVNVWGTDHHGYEERIRSSCLILGYEDKLKVIYISMVKVKKGGENLKMSKRQGTSLTIDDVLKFLTPNEIRYAMIEKVKEQGLVIDIDKIKQKNATNSYWYVQYANARINQLFTKFKANYEYKILKEFTRLTDGEKEIILKIANFEKILLKAARLFEPSVLWNYLKELTGLFHSYYNSFIIMSDDYQLSLERMNLLIKLKQQIEQVLFILGITPINKM